MTRAFWAAASYSDSFSKVKMDLVITWVDGSDPKWQKNCNAHLEEPLNEKELHTRYYPWDCLAILLRSVHKYADGVFRKVWIVHDSIQKPPVNENLVNLISHDLIMPAEILPTFNSSAIESYIHKIPGLSETFVYCNDDNWFSDTVSRETFFKQGLPRIFLSNLFPEESWGETLHGWHQPLYYTAKLLDREFGCKPRNIPRHLPKALSKTICWKSWELFERELNLHTASKFRRPGMIAGVQLASAHMLYQWVAIETGLGVVETSRPSQMESRDEEQSRMFLHLPEFSSPCPFEDETATAW